MSSSAGGYPHADITGRMAVFGRLFGEQVGVPEPSHVPGASELVTLVKERVPRGAAVADEAPVFEAAAYVGEWVRARSLASWIAEGPYEPHLQVSDPSHAVVYLLPLVNIMRTAATAGYDGLPSMLDSILDEVREPMQPTQLGHLRVWPTLDRGDVVHWVATHRHIRDGMRAALWRRCATCSTRTEDAITLPHVDLDWESEAATAAGMLASRPFRCPCGGLPGETTRFLMLRNVEGTTRLADIYISNNHTRVACWTLEGDQVSPFDALALATEGMRKAEE